MRLWVVREFILNVRNYLESNWNESAVLRNFCKTLYKTFVAGSWRKFQILGDIRFSGKGNGFRGLPILEAEYGKRLIYVCVQNPFHKTSDRNGYIIFLKILLPDLVWFLHNFSSVWATRNNVNFFLKKRFSVFVANLVLKNGLLPTAFNRNRCPPCVCCVDSILSCFTVCK